MSDELSYSCAFALATVCQRVVCELFAEPAALDVSVLAQRFAEVPHACSYNDAAVASSILLQFTIKLGTVIHQRVHRSEASGACAFHPESHLPLLPIDRTNPSAWKPGDAVAMWARRFSAEFGRTHDLLAERARARLLRNPAQRLPLAALARDTAASVSVVHRRFLATVGETPLQYRTRLRVLAAIPLIRQGWKIDSVAATVGWKTRKDLYRALRAVTGLLPLQIRALSEAEAQKLRAQLAANVYTAHPNGLHTL
jgi:AraC-like DNA-binding protein